MKQKKKEGRRGSVAKSLLRRRASLSTDNKCKQAATEQSASGQTSAKEEQRQETEGQRGAKEAEGGEMSTCY
jgi:hypothetical protein